MFKKLFFWLPLCFLLMACDSSADKKTILHHRIIVLVPGYEGSALFDPSLVKEGGETPCVWGSFTAFRHQEFYFALRMPNYLEARPLLRAGPIDVYGTFMKTLGQRHDRYPNFKPYTRNRDLFLFAYDWRQDIGTVTAPLLAQTLERYTKIYQQYSSEKSAPHFILVAHSMGSLVARTMLIQHPELAEKIDRLYLVGPPNEGSVKAIKTILVGPGGLNETKLDFPMSFLKFFPNDVTALTTKLVAITRPSIYELLPFQNFTWKNKNADGSSYSISASQLLESATWKPFWPTAEEEEREYITPWLHHFMGGEHEPKDPAVWEFCQNDENLKKILHEVSSWRSQLGALSETDKILTKPGEKSRLRLVVGRGLATPTGIISEGTDSHLSYQYTFDGDSDGDQTVLLSSALDDLKNKDQIFFLEKVAHAQLINHSTFLDYLLQNLSELDE